MTLRAIPTMYNGNLFRSRLEARWAVFFDALGVRYEYEKEGYVLPSGRCYLPDFWLPQQQCWYEIKAERPTDQEQAVLQSVAEGTKATAYITYGQLPNPLQVESSGPYETEGDPPAWLVAWKGSPTWDHWHTWCECPTCGKVGIEYESRAERLECGHAPYDKWRKGNTPRLLQAYLAARTKRFEFNHRE